MHWLLQEFDDTRALADVLKRLGVRHSWHQVVPFSGDMIPEPVVDDPGDVMMVGSYALWRFAQARGYRPGVFKLRPFVNEKPWQPSLLNGLDGKFLTLRDIPRQLAKEDRDWFMRPVDDSKAEPGRVRSARQIIALADQVLALDQADIPDGSLRHDTELMLTEPVKIFAEWRLWIVADHVVTQSLYKEGARVIYRAQVDADVVAFARRLVQANPSYAPAYVIDICRTDAGLKMIETNCLNAAGFYAADLQKLVIALEALGAPG